MGKIFRFSLIIIFLISGKVSVAKGSRSNYLIIKTWVHPLLKDSSVIDARLVGKYDVLRITKGILGDSARNISSPKGIRIELSPHSIKITGKNIMLMADLGEKMEEQYENGRLSHFLLREPGSDLRMVIIDEPVGQSFITVGIVDMLGGSFVNYDIASIKN